MLAVKNLSGKIHSVESARPTDTIDDIVEDMHEHFPDLEPVGLPIVGRILRLARYLDARREEQLAPYGLTGPDFDVLATLRRKASVADINVRDLQRSLMLSSGGMTKRLDRLESAGFTERHRDPDDRRGVLIALTTAGRSLIDETLPAITNAESELVAAVIGSSKLRSQAEDALRRLLIGQEAG